MTGLFVWPFQKYVLIRAYQIEQANRTARKKVKLSEEQQLAAYRATLLEKESKKVNAESKKIAAETKLSKTKQEAAKTDPTILWDEDYEKFKKTAFFNQFARIIECIYQHDGNYRITDYDDRVIFSLSPNLLAFVDTEELAALNYSAETISLTSKGKHFVKRYQEEVQK